MNCLSPLQLIGAYFTEVRITANSAAKAADLNRYNLEVETNASPGGDPAFSRTWFVLITVKLLPLGEIETPYHGEVKMIGSFEVDAAWPADQIEKLIYINGSGLLYSSIREMICAITARGFFTMLVIPSYSFNEKFKELEEKRKQQQSASNPPPELTSLQDKPAAG